MLTRMLNLREGEGRVVLLLGSLSFFLLAATTVQGAAADSLFLNFLGAEDMPYGMALAQVVAIVGFYGYRGLRQLLPTRLLSTAVVILLTAGLAAVFTFIKQESIVAVYALFTMVPLYASVLASESGRLSAALLNVRSARRLLPLIGGVGGAGAATGAYLVTMLTPSIGQAGLLLLAAALLMVILLPASQVRESMRPRVTSRQASAGEVFRDKHALALLIAAGLVIALSNLVRYQFNAAVADEYSGAEIAIFMGQFMLALNLASIVFAQFVGRVLIERMGAARTLLAYPISLAAIAAAGAWLPGLLSAAATQFGERLFRQNSHRTVANLVGMPLPAPIRIRMYLIITGNINPLAVLLTSFALLFTVGAQAPAHWDLGWQDLYWPIALIAAALFGALLVARVGYAARLQSALHARRLQLGNQNVEGGRYDADGLPVPVIDATLRLALHGYLASDLEERVALALRLLAGGGNRETLGIIRRQWPLWAPWLKELAVPVALGMAHVEANDWLREAAQDPDDAVRAAALAGSTQTWDPEVLQQAAQSVSTHPMTAAAALIQMKQAGTASDAAANEQLEAWIAGGTEEPAMAQAAVLSLTQWPDARYDHALPELARRVPEAALRIIAQRPDPQFAELCVAQLGKDRSFSDARAALLAIGLPAVPSLESAATDPTQPNASFTVIPSIEGENAHLANLRLMAHDKAEIRQLATLARLHGDFALSPAERALIEENLERSVRQATRFHSYHHHSTEPMLAQIAGNERLAILEHLFANLTLLYPDAPIRLAYLALQSVDARQRSFAIELLDEALPRSITVPLFPVLEDRVPGKALDPAEDRLWLAMQARLRPDQGGTANLQQLAQCQLFRRWRLADLEQLLKAQAQDPAAIVIRDGAPLALPTLLLTGQSPEPQPGDIVLPLAAVYQVARQSPRCGLLWLEALADLVPAPDQGSIEVTRSAMVSLASRVQAEDEREAGALDLWQRMFFLRSNTLTDSLPPARLRLVAEISRTLSAPAGTAVVHEGRLGGHFYMVLSGRLTVTQVGNVIEELDPGASFGALALLRGDRRLATVTAAEDTELLAIARTDFLDLLMVHPGLVRSFARSIASQIIAQA